MRLTKVYPDGTVTLDATHFNVRQEVIDSNIRNSKPIKAAVERLNELEGRTEPKKPNLANSGDFLCPSCGAGVNYAFCRRCGQALDWDMYRRNNVKLPIQEEQSILHSGQEDI